MHGMYNYIPETNHVPTLYSIEAVLYLQSVLSVIILPMKYVLYLYISTSCNMCAVPSMAVFCSYLVSCSPSRLLRYSLCDFERVPVAPSITGITLLSHSTCAEFLLYGLYILESSQLLS